MKISDRLRDTIEARRAHLGYTPTTLQAVTGLSAQGLKNIRKGVVRDYQERTTNPLCQALRWTPDSISRILAGGDPVEVEAAEPDPGEFSQLRGAVHALSQVVEELARRALLDDDEQRPAILAALAALSVDRPAQ